MAKRTGDVTDNPESKELLVKQAGTILVYDFPSKLSQNDIWIYFQKKKNSGGEVLQVSMRADTHDALVHFEDYKVAEAVVQRQNHVIKGYAVKVKLYKAEDDKKRRTVLVSRLPHDATKDSITIHFQTKKLGGGEVEDVQKLGEGKAMVVFKDFEVAKTIVNIKQTFEGSTVLTLKHMGMELDPTEAIKQGDIDIVGKENRTVLVSELPQGVSKNVVFIHFQKKKNNGGEVEEVTLLPEGNKAWVIFEDPKVAERVVNTDQTIQGKPVRVKLLTTETQPAERSVEPGTNLVSGLLEGMTKNDITMHFQRTRNGVGEVKNVQLSPDGKQAEVTFDDLEVAKTAVSLPQVIKKTTVTVTLLDNEKELVKETPPEIAPNPEVTRTPDVRTPPEVATTREVQPPEVPTATKNFETEENPSGTKTEKTMPDKVNPFFLVRQVDHVFSIVSATVGPAIINSAPEDFWNNIFKVIQKSCGVQLWHSDYGITLSGSFSQVAKAGELLGLQWERHCQDQQLRNSGHNFVNQAGMTFNQHPTTMNQAGTTFNQPGTTTNQVGTTFNQHPTTMNQVGTTFNQHPTAMNQVGTTFNQHPTTLNQAGTTFNQHPTTLNQAGTTFNQHPTTLNQVGTNFNQHPTTLNQAGTTFNQHPTTLNQAGTTFNRHGTNMNQVGTTFNQHATNMNQVDMPVNQHATTSTNSSQSNMHMYQGSIYNNQSCTNFNEFGIRHIGAHFNQAGTNLNQYAPPFNPSGTNSKRMGLPFHHQNTTFSPPAMPPPAAQQNRRLPPGLNREGQWPNGTDSDVRYEQPSDSKQPSIKEDTANSPKIGNPSNTHYTDETGPLSAKPPRLLESAKNPQSFGNIPNTHPVCTTQSPCAGETDTLGGELRRPVDGRLNPQPLGSQQPPGYVAKSLNPTCMEYEASEKMTGPSSAKPAPSPDNTRSSQSPDNGQKGTSPDTTRAGENTTLTVDDSTSPEFHSEKLPGLSETNINSQPQGGNQQSTTTDPTSRLQNSTNFSNKDGSCLNDQPDAHIEKLPPDNVTTPQLPSNDQKGTPQNPTIGSPNSATAAHQTGVPPSTNTSDSLSGKPPNTTEKTPNNQQHNQEQTSPDQIFNKQTSTDENVEISPNNSPASHPVVPPLDVTEQTQNSKNKQQKRTPTPRPRQNKPGSNERCHNAANFSSPRVKTKQLRQDSPAPTESNNSNNEKPLAATGSKEEGDQNITTKNSKTSITTEERDDTNYY